MSRDARAAQPEWVPRAVAFLADTEPGAVVAVVGMPRTGKTRAVKAADVAGVFPRRVVFDPYARRDLKLAQQGEPMGLPWGGTWCRAADLTAYPHELLDFNPCAVVVAPGEASDVELGAQFEETARRVWQTGRVDLIADEAGRYSRQAMELMGQIASGGGHSRMRLVLLCQSLSWLTIHARRFVSHVVCFAQGSPEDVDALGERCGSQFAARVRRLRGPSKTHAGSAPEFWRLGDADAVHPEGAPQGAREEVSR